MNEKERKAIADLEEKINFCVEKVLDLNKRVHKLEAQKK